MCVRGGNKAVHIFSQGISPKGNITAQLDFELTNRNVVNEHVTHNASRTNPVFHLDNTSELVRI